MQSTIFAARALSLVFLLICGSLVAPGQGLRVITGAELLVTSHRDLLAGRAVGLVANQTAVLPDGRHLADILAADPTVRLKALFGPEHGIRGDTTGAIDDGLDSRTGVPVYSLYGKSYRPTREQLSGIDVLVFDIQDVGARFYTYISTLGNVLSAAGEAGIPVIVLDRPNPIRGVGIAGPIPDDSLLSFVAYAPIPITHGMTMGELARMYNGEGWLENGVRVSLTVIAMEHWRRDQWYDQTGLAWIPPSPNMVSLETAVVYPGTCLLEGTNLSEGRGTERPFEYVGAPWMNSALVLEILESQNLPGVRFESIQFTPTRRGHQSGTVKYEGQGCNGLFVDVTDRSVFQPVTTGLTLLWALRAVHPDKFAWKTRRIDRLSGTPLLRERLEQGDKPSELVARWQRALGEFLRVRQRYLLYD
jgi:uncharacterized protein YbbC (DUF1343 family)